VLIGSSFTNGLPKSYADLALPDQKLEIRWFVLSRGHVVGGKSIHRTATKTDVTATDLAA